MSVADLKETVRRELDGLPCDVIANLRSLPEDGQTASVGLICNLLHFSGNGDVKLTPMPQVPRAGTICRKGETFVPSIRTTMRSKRQDISLQIELDECHSVEPALKIVAEQFDLQNEL